MIKKPVIHKKTVSNKDDRSIKNFIISTFLHSYRRTSPHFARKPAEFFQKFEPLFKDEVLKPNLKIGLILKDNPDEVKTFLSFNSLPNGGDILSWMIVREPNQIIYFYTKLESRRKGYGSRIFHELKDHFTSDELILIFFTSQGWSFLKNKKSYTGSEFKVFIE